MAAYSIILTYFNKKKGRAMALHSCFYGIGGLPGPFWITGCFREYGYTGTMIIMAAVALHTIPASLCFRPLSKHQDQVRRKMKPIHDKIPSDGNGSYQRTDFQGTVADSLKVSQSTNQAHKLHCCNYNYETNSKCCIHLSGCSHLLNVTVLAYMLCGLSFLAVYELNITLAAGLAKDKSFSTDDIRSLLSIINGVDIIMRIIGGMVIDYFEKWRPLVYSVMMVFIGVLAILLPLIESKVMSVVVWVIFQGFIGKYNLNLTTKA